jgi:hypothetical protein
MLLDCPEPQFTGTRRLVLLAGVCVDEPKAKKERWEARNPERAREIARLAKKRAYLKDPEKIRARNRANRLKNKDRINAAKRARRAAKKLLAITPQQGKSL